jgi:maltose O-acetyltransferase
MGARIMTALKTFWWNLRHEIPELVQWFASVLPGSIGGWLRRATMRRYLRHLGGATTFQRGFRITNPENVSIGSHCDFAQDIFLAGGGGIVIGDWVGFGPDTKVWSVNHRFDDPDRPWLLQGWEKKTVTIEDDVWLAANVFVMPGVTIGKGAIIAAGTIVSKSIPPYAVVGGNPGRIIGWRKNTRPKDTNVAHGSTTVEMQHDNLSKAIER